MKKIDKIVDKVLSIGIRKWLLCNLLIFAFELIYCDINICEYDLTWLKVFWTCLFCYSPVIQAKLNIFTGANESMVGYKAWEKYMSLIVGIPAFIFACFSLILLMIRKDMEFAIMVFIGPTLLYSCCKAVDLYNKQEK